MRRPLRERFVALKRLAWAAWVRLRPQAAAPAPPRVRQVAANGLQLLVCANEDVGRGLTLFGEYEPRETRFLLQEIRPDDTCVDVGANVGYYTILMAAAARAGRVHAFEPIPFNALLLAASLEMNGLRNVVVNRAAVGATDGERELHLAMDSAYSSFRDTGRRPITRRLPVPVIALDSYVRTAALPRIDVLKVDVEGAEMEVLDGAAGLLRDADRSPRLLLLELYEPMLTHFGTTIDAVVERLGTDGYRPFVVSDDGLVPFAREHHNRFYNVIFRSLRHTGQGPDRGGLSTND